MSSSPTCFATSTGPRTRRTAERHTRARALSSRGALATFVVAVATLPAAPATADLHEMPVPAFAPTPSATAGQVYDGILTTTIRDFDRCGDTPEDKTATLPAQLIVGPPISSAPAEPGFPPAVGKDTNPISLLLDEGGEAGTPGALRLSSAARIAAVSPPLVLQFWTLRRDGPALSGVLGRGHRAESAAANLLADDVTLDPCRPFLGELPNQFAIAEGAELGGMIANETVELAVRGATEDQTRLFASRFAGASR